MIRSIQKFFIDTFGDKETIRTKNIILKDSYLDMFLDDGPGQLILMDLMEFAGFARVNYHQQTKPEDMIFLEGQRSVIHYILQKAEISELDLLRKDRIKKEK